MNAFLYGLALQWKLDLRSKTLLITCYRVPLLFFVMMGGIFTTCLLYTAVMVVQPLHRTDDVRQLAYALSLIHI